MLITPTAARMIESLIGVGVGASLTLLVQVTIQLLVIPQVESRKRREDRWERNVLELGELLVGDLPPALIEYNIAILLRGLVDERENLSAAKKREAANRLSEAYMKLDAIHESKVHWLMKRITSLAPDSPDLKRFEKACFLLHADLVLITAARHLDDKANAVSNLVDKCDKHRRTVIERLEELSARTTPPRQPFRNRFPISRRRG